MKPKLFFLINSLHKGGAERVLSTLSNSFDERGFPVLIVCLNYSEQGYPLAEGVKVIYLFKNAQRSEAFLMRIWYAIATYLQLLYLLIRERPGCVIAFMTTSNLWAGLSCIPLRIPYIVSERTTPEHTIKKYGPWLRWVLLKAFKHAKAIVSPARGVEECLREIDGFRDLLNYKVINNPIHPKNSIVHAGQQSVHPRPFMLAVGRLAHQKGFDLLIDAFSKLTDLHLDLLIAGQGKEYLRLQEQIKRLKLEQRVFLIGVKDQLSDYYKASTLFVLSSRHEGYPNVLIEAMSMGCACIAMDCDFGPSEIINHRVNGILVSKFHPNDLAQAIRELVNDPSLRKKLSDHARQINKTNALEVVVDRWEQLVHPN